MTEHLVIIAQT